MRTPTAENANAQPWVPGHWITLSGYALDPTDLRMGTNLEADEPRDQIVAAVETDLIIFKMVQP